MVALRMAIRVISVVSQLLLVRLLVPADFGLVASAGAIGTMLDVLSEFSLTWALVQMPDPTRRHYDTAFTLVVARGLLIGGVLWGIAGPVATFLHEPRIADIVRVFAVVPVVQGFESVGLITLQRRLQFGRVFLYRLLGKLLGFVVAIPLAFLLRDYWALVWGGVAARLLAVPLSYVLAPHRPGVSLHGFAALFGFSKWLFLNNVLTMLDGAMMTMVLGRFSDVRAVGLYQVSNDLAAMPASEVAAPIRAPMYAGYARVADDIAALRGQVLSGLGFLVMIIVPMSVGIAATAPDAVAVALGARWAGAAPVVALCALAALFDAIGHFTGNVYLVRGAQRPYVGIMALCLALRLALVVPAALLGGLVPAVAMLALTALANALLWFARMRPLLGVGWGAYAAVTWRSFAAAAAMAAVVLGLRAAWPEAGAGAEAVAGEGEGAMALHWAALCAAGACVHVGVQGVLWGLAARPPGPETRLLGLLRGRLRRRSVMA
jgi:O-antigen/teichoic acid export membrane protein